jgi:aminoglycoside phosphotransferase (APT) family kinase protein
MAFSLADPPQGWPKELVARLMPDAKLAQKETIVQRAVAAAGFPTPAVRAAGDADAGLGRAFMVMDRAPGAPLLSGLSGISAGTSALSFLPKIPERLASAMARLHALELPAIRTELKVCEVPVNVSQFLSQLQIGVEAYGRSDLVAAAGWLADHRPSSTDEVVCHGDLHPFNLLADGDNVTVLDWSAAVLGPRAYDVAFTSIMLSEPPLIVPRPIRPITKGVGRLLARRFIRRYHHHANVRIDAAALRWHQGVVCLRALTEVAGWVQQGVADGRAGHPWIVSGPALAHRLSTLVGQPISPR